MATLNLSDHPLRVKTLQRAQIPLAPVAGDDGHADLGSSVRFSIGVAGDGVVITATGPVHVLAGDVTVVATTSCPVFDQAVHLTLPDGCTHVALLEAEADVSGCAYRG